MMQLLMLLQAKQGTLFILQFAAFVVETTSTHVSRWFSALASHPRMQISMFIFFFAIQMILFVIFVQEVLVKVQILLFLTTFPSNV